MSDGRLTLINSLRDEISKRQVREVKNLYKGVLSSLYREERRLLASGANSSSARLQQIRELRTTAQKLLSQLGDNLFNIAYSGIEQMVRGTLDAYGHDMAVQQAIVSGLVTGSIYGGNDWSLSSSIWGANSRQLRDIYNIVARGQLLGLSVEDIAKQLQKYVNPDVVFRGTGLGDVYVSSPHVDYNATRLVRTLTTHAYQYAQWVVTYNDPNLVGYRWHANGPRACQICRARDGVIFNKDSVPWDHPNGMCYIEPVYEDMSVLNEFIGYAEDRFMRDFINRYIEKVK